MAVGTGTAILGGAGLSLLGGALGADAQRDAANAAANSAQWRGTGVTSGFGSVTPTKNPDGTWSYNTTLDPRYAAYRDQLFGMGQGFLQQAQNYDPNQAGALFTKQLREQSAPSEQADRMALENRLFQQGLMGSTLGVDRYAALNEAQRRADVQREMQGYQLAQETQGNLFNRGLQGIQAGTAIEGLTGDLMQQSIGASGGQQSGRQAGANFQFQAGMNRGDMLSGFFGSLGQGLGNYGFSGGGGRQPIYGADPLFNYQQQYNFQGNMAPQAFGPQ